MPFKGAVLIDTNTILECHAKRCWKALAGAYRLETVEACVTETQTGRQRRRPEEQIDEVELRKSVVVHPVTDLQLAAVLVRGAAGLDEGEKALWAHALSRTDVWVLCGPDRASMKFGYDCGRKDALVSLGGLLNDIGVRSPVELAPQYERAWLERVINRLVMGAL